ncbi:hypothetical protein [Desulfovibrio sp. JC010]|uniref:hypothetical protein n=1 Tax=Desulfovibrio sp. JC010 TaxID=2593641 RepID=UPI0013D48C5C|nr:hypothetical protein [Desulfovibrio sp. JC010]NDV27737.1 hypothetical protein [Desulfovibrio sp. JC010]
MKAKEIQKHLSKISKQTIIEVSAVMFEKVLDESDHEDFFKALKEKDTYNKRQRLCQKAKRMGIVK